jgi:hypothetical protein
MLTEAQLKRIGDLGKAQDARIVELEAALRAYHDWHLNLDDDAEGYLDSKLFEQAKAAMPELAEPKE